MNQLKNFGRLRQKFSAGVDFVTVYISEAHPTEQGLSWENYGLRQHQALEEKIEAANILKREAKEALEGCPILVDGMEHEAEKKYQGLPERLYVIMDNKIVYAGGMGPFGYSVDEVDAFLSKMQ
eukprot:TRINITY_DN10636_c0_g1_i3.p2 TRINITY_DN10636_c0_g1~~TRINITY_DN10636_c0_g1_i3.p2  ORF type:complete len:124 (-),score=45.29 TRINITY_DN10636_c0_g1_i3:309-680(-)